MPVPLRICDLIDREEDVGWGPCNTLSDPLGQGLGSIASCGEINNLFEIKTGLKTLGVKLIEVSNNE